MAIPQENFDAARQSFNDFFEQWLDVNNIWTYSIGSEPNWQTTDSPPLTYIVACFHEVQFTGGFTTELQTAAINHSPTFASFGASADVVEDPHAYLTSLGLEPIPMEMP